MIIKAEQYIIIGDVDYNIKLLIVIEDVEDQNKKLQLKDIRYLI